METKSNNGWTLDTLEKYLSNKIDSVEKILTTRSDGMEQSVATALTSAEKAITKSDQATERRFESVNEFRQTLQDQTQTFLPRGEYTASHQAVETSVADAISRLTKIEALGLGRSQGTGLIGAIVVGGFIVLSSIINLSTLAITFFAKH